MLIHEVNHKVLLLYMIKATFVRFFDENDVGHELYSFTRITV